ncbi:integral membrane protein [Cryptococcus wingfieldii CBS 7118]|uniref:Integral membrane protein n=1 Tax=Cryptococcus wingfieldii CBS 7118 TaxID=1295528 RepID=A0A1E3JR68_9TREE|nr:integral membrane protein [Cryptococcus wingfieldii CBS 7118]ODO03345.1 integral membrane protein [Cryptococcus wingfieldii CBS 7118]
MKENKAAENALGTIGAVFWMVQIAPQIVKSHREKTTKGLSASLMFIWGLASLFLGSYNVVQELSIPLQVQPQAFGVLAAISWCQCLHYERGYSKKSVWAIFIVFCCIFAGFEAGSVFALRAGLRNGTEWPITMYGYITAVLLAVALLPQYWEIYRFREVIGISLMFMAVDILGGIFSFASLFFRTDLDVAAFVSYVLVVILDGIVVLLYFILNPIARRRRRAEGTEGERVGDPEAGWGSTSANSTEPTLVGHGMVVDTDVEKEQEGQPREPPRE